MLHRLETATNRHKLGPALHMRREDACTTSQKKENNTRAMPLKSTVGALGFVSYKDMLNNIFQAVRYTSSRWVASVWESCGRGVVFWFNSLLPYGGSGGRYAWYAGCAGQLRRVRQSRRLKLVWLFLLEAEASEGYVWPMRRQALSKQEFVRSAPAEKYGFPR